MTPANEAHIRKLVDLRPDWNVCSIDPLFRDESYNADAPHAYHQAHPYIRGMKDTLRLVNKYAPDRVLDIGSPLAQSVALSYMTDLTVLDTRAHQDPSLGLNFVEGSACNIPFPDASWDMVTSLWVMCHVGDGRYGDELEPEGDLKMLAEVHRVLRPGGVAVLGVGPMGETPSILFNVHRIYSWLWLRKNLGAFNILEEGEYPISGDMYVDPHWHHGGVVLGDGNGVYGFVVLQKKAN